MRFFPIIPAALALGGVAASATAQNPSRVTRISPSPLVGRAYSLRGDSPNAVIGITTSGGSSIRDTLGVFVMSVDDAGPAAKAGIEEGNRIASINGVDLRASRADEDDILLRTSNARRLEREIAKLKAGDDADLRVYAGGQYRTVKV